MNRLLLLIVTSVYIKLCPGQEITKKGCFQIYSDPDRVKIEIPELKLKTLKDTFLYEVKDLLPGRYTILFRYKLNSLNVPVMMADPDTFIIYANFKNLSSIAVTKSDFIAYNQKQLKMRKTTDSLHTDTSRTFYIVEDMPLFNGGDPALEFRKFIAENMRYPLEAAEKGISGRVIVKFIIDEEGNLINPEIAQSAHPLLDKEALRVLSLSPKWKPGKQKGKSVKVFYTFPLNFFVH